MAGSKSLTRLENKFLVLRQRQEQMQARFKEEIKKTQRAIEGKRGEFILQTIRRINFPLDKPVVLIGAILDAKQKLEGAGKADIINRYIRLYNDFAATHPNFEPFSEEETDAEGHGTEKQTADRAFGSASGVGVSSYGREPES